MKGKEVHSSDVSDRVSTLGLSGPLAVSALLLIVSSLVTGSMVNAQPRRQDGLVSDPRDERFTSMLLSSEDVPYLNCRFGVGQSENPVTFYDIAPLNLGWYANWGAQADPARPGGIEYVQMLRTSDGEGHTGQPSYSPAGDTLAAMIAANPGSLWLVGNEPDCIWQDDVMPENYAVAYHDAYEFIKQHDPSAQVAVGGIVQPTPLRMDYLDLVLDAYISLYGEPLPTDAWHIHSFILREASCAVYEHCWGSEIPPGIRADSGEMYEVWEVDDLDIFRTRIFAFRSWMQRHGYRDKPLYITEYGTLWPYYEYPFVTNDGKDVFDEARAGQFMTSTFDFLLTANDPDTGYSADENRLVQRWLWYSLDSDAFGGALFDKNTGILRPLGKDFADYTGTIPPTTDLLAVEVGQVGPVPLSPTDAVTITLEARISNVGNAALTEGPITVRFLDEEGQTIGSDVVVDEALPGCAATRSVTTSWSHVEPGAHSVRLVVDPEDAIEEADETNNEVYGVALVAEHQIFLPLTFRNWRP